MTKKNYVLIAKSLRDSRPELPFSDSQYVAKKQWSITVENIAHDLAKDNERFNRQVFLRACGYLD